MNNLENLLKLYKIQLEEIMQSEGSYKEFLTFAAPFYKYNISDIVLIYASNPKATQCADLDTWTNRLGLKIKDTAIGIPIIAKTEQSNVVKYVFDVSDVLETDRSIPTPWTLEGQVTEDTIAKLIDSLYTYDIDIKSQISTNCMATNQLYEDTNFLNKPIYQEFMQSTAKYLINVRCKADTSGISFPDIPKLKDMSDTILLNHIALLTAQTQLNKISKNIKGIRRKYDEYKKPISREFDNERAGSIGDRTNGTGEHGNRQIWQPLDTVYERETPQGNNGNGAEQQLLQDSTSERQSGTGNETNSDRAYESKGNNAKRPTGKGSVGKSDKTKSRRNNHFRDTDEYVEQFSLFSMAAEKSKIFEEHENNLLPNKQEVIAFPVGDFYELYGNDAVKAHEILDVCLTHRTVNQIKMNMVGIPKHSFQDCVSRFNEHGYILIASSDNPILNPKNNISISTEKEIELTVSEPIPLPATETQKLNYKIPHDFAVPSGAKGKYQCNISAIQLLKQIESESRFATFAEQEILSQYVGFGGIPQAFDDSNDKWSKEYSQLKNILTKDEYIKARASTLNAHYTSVPVIKAMYEVLDNLGFEGGKILEPALGVGKFFGMLPSDTAKKSKLYGTELDSITGRIACQLYQDADIQVKGFEETNYANEYFDVAISNVPFGDFNLSDGKYNMLIHDYFFLKSLDSVKTGGIVAFISSKGTLDKANPSVRKQLAQRADLLGAIRLPNTAFKTDAGTEVTTDILFLQKRSYAPLEEPSWVYLDYYDSESDIKVNSYFKENPNMVLGKMVYSSLYGRNKDTACVLDSELSFEEELSKAVKNIKGKFNTKENFILPKEIGNLPLDGSKPFTYSVINENVYYNNGNVLELKNMTGVKLDKIKVFDNIRLAVNDVIDIQLSEHFTEEKLREKQEILNGRYDYFVSKYGFINERVNQLLFSEDMDIALLSSIEDKIDDTYVKGAIFTKATIRKKVSVINADTPIDALLISLADKGKVDPVFMSSLCGVPVPDIMNGLIGHVFIDPVDYNPDRPVYLTAEEYLSDNVKSKLAVAEQTAELYPDIFTINVNALLNVQPEWVSACDIGVRLSSNWIDEKYINEFIYMLLKTPDYYNMEKAIAAKYDTHAKEWFITNKTRHSNVLSTEKYGTSRICEEIDDTVLSFAEVKAIASGDPLIRERMELEMEVDKLTILKAQHKKQHYYLQDKLTKEYPKKLEQAIKEKDNISKDCIKLFPLEKVEFAIEIKEHNFTERAKAGEYLQIVLSEARPSIGKPIAIGKYKGMDISVVAGFENAREFKISGNHSYYASVGEAALGNITRIENKVNDVPKLLRTAKQKLSDMEDNAEQTKKELAEPFSQEKELATKKQRLIEITSTIGVEAKVMNTITAENDVVSY